MAKGYARADDARPAAWPAFWLSGLALLVAMLGAAPAYPQAALAVGPDEPSLGEDIRSQLETRYLAGTRWGLVAMGEDGEELVSIEPDERFLPASNTKLFTLAAAFRWKDELEAMAPELATTVRLEPGADGGAPDIALVGRGATELGDGPRCVEICLSELADAVVAAGVTSVGDVVGDDSWFPDERWRGGMSWDDMATEYGTAVSALVVNDNVLRLQVWSGAAPGDPIGAQWREGDDLYALDLSDTVTVSGGARLWVEQVPGSGVVRLHGTLAAGSRQGTVTIGLYDPAEAAARRFARLLEARGVTVEGAAKARHRGLSAADEVAFGGLFLQRQGGGRTLADPAPGPALSEPAPEGAREIARTPPPDLDEMLRDTGKYSQNLYAELTLRQLGRISGRGSAADGLVRIYALADEAGISPRGIDLNDGAGMSVYNRVSPRATAQLLMHAQAQDWGEDFRAVLPIGGYDGTLGGRFRGTSLQGRVFAKTGTLTGTNALSGYLTAASGRTIVFSAFANDRPQITATASPTLDAALAEIARAY